MLRLNVLPMMRHVGHLYHHLYHHLPRGHEQTNLRQWQRPGKSPKNIRQPVLILRGDLLPFLLHPGSEAIRVFGNFPG